MPTGVEVYSDEVIDGLLTILGNQKDHKIRLYSPDSLPNIPKNQQKIIPGSRLWTQWHLSREMKTNPPDVLFVPSHVLPLNHPERSVITIHDVAFRSFPSAYSFFQYLYLDWSTKYAVKHAWKIVVPSESTRQDLIQFYGCDPSKLILIPHGFRPQPFDLSKEKELEILKKFHLSPGDPYALFIGRLEMKKNISRLIQAFAQFHHKHTEWQLILGGKRGVGFRSIMKALEREDVLADVLMPGYLTDNEKHVLMKNASIFTFPSLSEGFGFPILEAASYQIPILASRIPALLDFEELIDVFVDPHDVSSMAKGLAHLAKSKSAKKKEVSSYSWAKNARKLWNLLTHS